MDRKVTLPWRPATARNSKGWQTNAPCKFFAQGKCWNGQTCSFSHAVGPEPTPLGTDAEETPAQSTSAEGDTRKQVTCRFYTSGGCLKGETCPFAHLDVGSASGGVVGDLRDVGGDDMDEV